MQDNVWCISVSDTAHWAEWADEHECVVHMQRSGETVVVSTLSIAILEVLRKKQCNTAQLVRHISQCMDESVDELTLALAVKSNITQLQQIGAIDNATPVVTLHRSPV